MKTNRRIPDNYTEHAEAIMSNLDHSIEEDIAEEIKGKELYAQYSGWHFCGYVWWQDDKWCCEVWRYNSHVATFESDTLEEIMQEVSMEYGHD